MSDRLPAGPVGEALDILADVASWQLTPQRWADAAASLQRMAQALVAGDAAALATAVAELEEQASARIVRIGSRAATGIPDQVLDLRNALVHSLGRRRPAPEEPDGRPH